MVTVGLSALTVVLVLPVLLFPLNSDNDIYQSMAFAFVKGKGLPYLGSWDHNFPGIVAYHWLGIKLFGLSDLAFRIIDVCNRLGIAFLAYKIAREFVDAELSWLAPLLVVIHYAGAGLWNAGQRDGFAALWILLALLASIRFRGESVKLALIAIAIAAATMIRPTNLLIVAPFGVHLLYTKRWKMLAQYLGAYLLAMLVMLSPWWLAERGIEQFYFSAIRFNLDLYSPERNGLNALGSVYLYRFLFASGLLGFALFIVRAITKRDGSSALWWIAAYFLSGVMAVIAMGKFHVYHFEVVIPSLIFFTIYIIARLKRTKVRLIAGSLIVVVAAMLYFPRNIVSQFLKNGANAEAASQIARNLASFDQYSLETEQNVSSRIEKYHLDDDQIEFALLWPGLRWRSGHPGITRFTTTYSMTLPSKSGMPAYQQAWIKEYDSVLTTVRPAMIVAALGPDYLAFERGKSSDAFLHSLPGVDTMLSNDYHVDTVIGGYELYRRSDVAKID